MVLRYLLILIIFSQLSLFHAATSFDAQKEKDKLMSLIDTNGEANIKLLAGKDWSVISRLLDAGNKAFLKDRNDEAIKKWQEVQVEINKVLKRSQISKSKTGLIQLGKLSLNPRTAEISFPATVLYPSMNEDEEMPIEVLIATQSGRTYEALFSADIIPFQLQTLLIAMGAKNGARKANEKFPVQGDILKLEVAGKYNDGKAFRHPITNFVKTEKNIALPKELWVFTGSSILNGRFQADLTGDIAVNYSNDNAIIDCIDDNISTTKTELISNFPKTLPEGTEVTIIISRIRSGETLKGKTNREQIKLPKN